MFTLLIENHDSSACERFGVHIDAKQCDDSDSLQSALFEATARINHAMLNHATVIDNLTSTVISEFDITFANVLRFRVEQELSELLIEREYNHSLMRASEINQELVRLYRKLAM